MNSENYVADEQAAQAGQPKAGECKHIPIIVVLAILSVCGFGFGIFELYQNINNNQAYNMGYEQNDDENVVEDDNTPSRKMITGSALFEVPNPYGEEANNGTVKFEYGVYNDVLSSYSINYYVHPYGYIVSEVISDNIDLNTGEKLDNLITLERFGFTPDEVYRKILNNIVETVSVDAFLLDVNGNIDADEITVNDFKKNIDGYVEILKNNQDLFYIFLKGSKVTVSYEQSKILEKLSMSSHMGAGLVDGYVEVEM